MAFLDFFKQNKPTTAQLAKERLQVIVAHQRAGNAGAPDYLPKLQKDLLRVIRKYVTVSDDAVNIGVERDGELEVLELNITLPNSQ